MYTNNKYIYIVNTHMHESTYTYIRSGIILYRILKCKKKNTLYQKKNELKTNSPVFRKTNVY